MARRSCCLQQPLDFQKMIPLSVYTWPTLVPCIDHDATSIPFPFLVLWYAGYTRRLCVRHVQPEGWGMQRKKITFHFQILRPLVDDFRKLFSFCIRLCRVNDNRGEGRDGKRGEDGQVVYFFLWHGCMGYGSDVAGCWSARLQGNFGTRSETVSLSLSLFMCNRSSMPKSMVCEMSGSLEGMNGITLTEKRGLI